VVGGADAFDEFWDIWVVYLLEDLLFVADSFQTFFVYEGHGFADEWVSSDLALNYEIEYTYLLAFD